MPFVVAHADPPFRPTPTGHASFQLCGCALRQSPPQENQERGRRCFRTRRPQFPFSFPPLSTNFQNLFRFQSSSQRNEAFLRWPNF